MSFDMTSTDVIQANKAIPALPDTSLEAGPAGKGAQAAPTRNKKMKLQFKERDQYRSQVRAHMLRYFSELVLVILLYYIHMCHVV
jgi:hypothetical protein